MAIVVFWLEESNSEFFQGTVEPRYMSFTDIELTEALAFCQSKRKKHGVRHVCLSSENPNSVGMRGVDSVVEGKTPDGHDYTWTKRRM